MKALILTVADKRHMTMVSLYEEYFSKNSIPYDIIRINRYIKTDDVRHYKEGIAEIYEFPFVESTNNSKLSKVIPFLKYRKFAKKIMSQKNYDFIVVWNENTALLFIDFLLKYKNKYCFNIRDVPEIPFTKKIYNILINKSYFSTSPTPAKIFDNDEKIITLYNRDIKLLSNVEKKVSLKSKEEILNVVFLGFYGIASKTFERISKVFANDGRFKLYFYGDGFDVYLKKYIEQEHIYNVCVGGAFPYEKTYDYLKETDIINSFYDNFDTDISRPYSAGIKVSYTPMLYIPAFTDDNTAWATLSRKYGFTYIVKNNNIDNLPNNLYNWYHSLVFEDFKKGCDDFNEVVDMSRKKVFKLLDQKLSNNDLQKN